MKTHTTFLLLTALGLLPLACGDDSKTVVIVDCDAGAAGENAGGEGGRPPEGGSGGTSSLAGAPAGGSAGFESGGAGGEAGSAGRGGEGGLPEGRTSLEITIAGKPAESVATVIVSGPAGFEQTLTTSTTLHDLAPGTYAVSARPARVDGPLVDELFGAVVSQPSVELGDGDTAEVSVEYAPTKLGGSGMLWQSNSGSHSLLGYSAEQMTYEGEVSEAPSVTLTLPELGASDALPGPIAFDPFSGMLWVGYCGTGYPAVIAGFEPAALVSSGPISATVEIDGPNDPEHLCVTALAFDARGDLWAGYFSHRFMRYERSALAQSGAPAPQAEFFANDLPGLQDLAFDAAGNLFVSAYLNGIVQKYLPVSLTQSSNAPESVMDWVGANVAGPAGLAFDPSGRLWVSTYDDASFRGYGPVAQATSGNPTPAAALTSPDVGNSQFIAFDEAGNLWIAGYDDERLFRIDAADLDAEPPVNAAAAYTSPDMSANYSVRLNPPLRPE